MVTSVSGGVHATTDGVGRSLDRLRTDVARKEAVNDAKRGLAPASTRSSTNALARQWNRLESLKKYRETPAGQDAAKTKLLAPTAPASTQASTEAATKASTPASTESATDAATDADTPSSTP